MSYEQKCWTCKNATHSECVWIRSKGTKHIKGTELDEQGYIKNCPKYEEEKLNDIKKVKNVDFAMYGLTKQQCLNAYKLYYTNNNIKSKYKTFEDYLLKYAIAKENGSYRVTKTNNQLLMEKYNLSEKEFYNAKLTYQRTKMSQKYKTLEEYLNYRKNKKNQPPKRYYIPVKKDINNALAKQYELTTKQIAVAKHLFKSGKNSKAKYGTFENFLKQYAEKQKQKKLKGTNNNEK